MQRAAASPATSATFNVNAGTNKAAFAMIAFDVSSGLSITGVTLAGNAMTSAGTAANNNTDGASGNKWSQIFYITESGGLTNGTNQTLTVTASGSVTDIYFGLVVFQGVDQTTPVRPTTYQRLTNPVDPASIIISSNANDYTISCYNTGGSGSDTTNQTKDGSNITGTYGGAHDHCTTPAASVTHTWSGAAGERVSLCGLSVQEVQAVAPKITGISTIANISTITF